MWSSEWRDDAIDLFSLFRRCFFLNIRRRRVKTIIEACGNSSGNVLPLLVANRFGRENRILKYRTHVDFHRENFISFTRACPSWHRNSKGFSLVVVVVVIFSLWYSGGVGGFVFSLRRLMAASMAVGDSCCRDHVKRVSFTRAIERATFRGPFLFLLLLLGLCGRGLTVRTDGQGNSSETGPVPPSLMVGSFFFFFYRSVK